MKIKIEIELDTERDQAELENLMELIESIRQRELEEFDDD